MSKTEVLQLLLDLLDGASCLGDGEDGMPGERLLDFSAFHAKVWDALEAEKAILRQPADPADNETDQVDAMGNPKYDHPAAMERMKREYKRLALEELGLVPPAKNDAS